MYQVIIKEFFIDNGIEYLSAVSPFSKGLIYKCKALALSVATSILNEYLYDDDTLKVNQLEQHDDKLFGYVIKKYGIVSKIIVEVEEIDVK